MSQSRTEINSSTLDEVRQIAADVFSVPIDQITDKTSADSIDGWDSIQHLSFVLALEQQFHVQFEPEEVEQILSVELAAMLVDESKGKMAA